MSAKGARAPGGDALEALERAVGEYAPALLACLREEAGDLVICSGAGFVLYSLQVGPTSLRWEQRLLAYPEESVVRRVAERTSWETSARQLCLDSPQARVCRVGAGVVAAEARACEAECVGSVTEEAVHRVSLAAAEGQIDRGGRSVKSGRLMAADVEQARGISHVSLRPLQRALAEEVAMGRSFSAVCSRSEHFSSTAGNGSATSFLCRRLGLLPTRDPGGAPRYARVAPYELAEKLCEALDVSPQRLGL